MKQAAWQHVSDEAKEFVQSLIVLDPSARMTAEQALDHAWVKQEWERVMRIQVYIQDIPLSSTFTPLLSLRTTTFSPHLTTFPHLS